jgi:hypothetical protein
LHRESRGKRSIKIGTLLPNIVLYNDPTPHPSSFDTSTLISCDLGRRPDLLLIFGTSLKVFGIKKLVKDFAKTVHEKKGTVIYINRTPLPSPAEWQGVIDYWVEADCDDWVHDLKTRIPGLWMKQETLPDMPVIKPTPKKRSTPKHKDVLDLCSSEEGEEDGCGGRQGKRHAENAEIKGYPIPRKYFHRWSPIPPLPLQKSHQRRRSRIPDKKTPHQFPTGCHERTTTKDEPAISLELELHCKQSWAMWGGQLNHGHVLGIV